MSGSIWILTFFSFIVLFALYFDLWRGKFSRKFWWLYTVMTGCVVNYLFWTWRWDLFSYYFRYLMVVIFVWVAIRSYFRVYRYSYGKFRRYSSFATVSPPTDQKSDSFQAVCYGGVLLFFGLSSIVAIYGCFHQEDSVQLRFPLKNGVYYVSHGGNSAMINYHYFDMQQKFALDFMELNFLGMRGWGLTPKSLDEFQIYRKTVYSPCTGRVVKVVDGIQENQPLLSSRQRSHLREHMATGNHVIIKCQGVRVTLAHMIPGSLRVKEKEKVIRGKPIGRVGNSGNSSEPHLHIHAEKEGKGVPIHFKGQFLTRNRIFLMN